MSVYVIRMSANNFTRVILNTLLYRVKLGFPLNVVFAFRQICEVQSLLEHSSPRIFYNQCFSSFSSEKLFLSLLSRCLHFEFREKKLAVFTETWDFRANSKFVFSYGSQGLTRYAHKTRFVNSWLDRLQVLTKRSQKLRLSFGNQYSICKEMFVKL